MFSATGGTVKLICAREMSMIAFTVEDRGTGIPEDYQQAVFDRFESRAHGSRHRGAGLGLSIVKSLAELHGGTVTLVSAPGEGTSVKVLLPRSQDDEQLDAEPQYKINRAG
jgi:signal transduction histidine kinase